MALVTDYEKIEAGRKIIGWKTNVIASVAQIDATFQNLINLKTDYPSDATEIDQYISQLKTLLINTANKY